MSTADGPSGEDALIRAILAAVPHLAAPDGPGDDAAVVMRADAARVVTTDALIEGTHFLRGHPPEALGWKSLAVNLSDVGAMGARAEAFTLALALPRGLDRAWVDAFARGLGACARASGVVIAGGDTVASPGPIVVSITAWGTLAGSPLTRSGGRAGDVLMVAGPIGRSGLGLVRWLASPQARADLLDDPCLRAHLRPEPPLWAGPLAAAGGAHAGMDLSDGLATDLPRLARASGLVIVVDLDRLPPDDAVAAFTSRERAAHGEDYGLAILAPPERAAALGAHGFAAIGFARDGAPGVLWREAGREVEPVVPAFAHFE
ncbi:MAG: thiamine-phosphate kinase [Myxococcota bacterium]